MNFFEYQDEARRNTKLLITLFVLAVVSLIVLTNALVFVFMNVQDSARMMGATGWYYSWEIAGAVSIGVVILIAIASLFRMHTLGKGGSAVAEMMNGKLLSDHGGDLHKRKLLNVVEEMAIAASTPVPPVYLIPEQAINAFAAGYSPGDAVIGVTEGAMKTLSRDELQGVIAHEFSHILNGDMRLNIRLMGVLYGILMMTIVGRILLNSGRGSRSRSDGAIVGVGLGLVVIGYLGTFFGNVIKAAVSRQREYLADASAVQFTRNPDGIAGALKKIGGYKPGTVLEEPESEEISHALFCQGVKAAFMGMMATHPPIDERILRIDPQWDGRFPVTDAPPPTPDDEMDVTPEAAGAAGFAAAAGAAAAGAAAVATAASESTASTVDADAIVDLVGNPTESRIEKARRIIDAIPDELSAAAHEPYSARAVIYLIQLHRKSDIRDQQLKHLQEAADMGVYEALENLLPHLETLVPEMRLPLLEMSLPSLRQLSYEQYKLFLSNLDALIRADGRVGLSEWAVQMMVQKHLGTVFEGKHSEPRFGDLKNVQSHCEVLLSMLAYCDRDSKVDPETAFTAGQEETRLKIQLQDKKTLSFRRLQEALEALADLHPLKKPRLLKACVKTILADNVISTIEMELLRAIADLLECPIPPMDIDSI